MVPVEIKRKKPETSRCPIESISEEIIELRASSNTFIPPYSAIVCIGKITDSHHMDLEDPHILLKPPPAITTGVTIERSVSSAQPALLNNAISTIKVLRKTQCHG